MVLTYKIGEAARLLNLKTYVLRFWETEFPQIVPLRTEKGQRLYTEENIVLLERIRFLLHERGLTIEGARKVLAEEASRGVQYTRGYAERLEPSEKDAGEEPAAASLHGVSLPQQELAEEIARLTGGEGGNTSEDSSVVVAAKDPPAFLEASGDEELARSPSAVGEQAPATEKIPSGSSPSPAVRFSQGLQVSLSIPSKKDPPPIKDKEPSLDNAVFFPQPLLQDIIKELEAVAALLRDPHSGSLV